MEQNFRDHDRRVDDEFRNIVDRKLKELDERREANLKYKLDAIEKLFNSTIETKSEALSIAVSRIQGEGTACVLRCRDQVNAFYKLINQINADIVRISMIAETLTKEELASENEMKLVNERVDTVNSQLITRGIRVDDLMKFARDAEEEYEKFNKRIAELELWKSLDFKRSIIITVVAIITAIQVVVWLKEKFLPDGV